MSGHKHKPDKLVNTKLFQRWLQLIVINHPTE